MVLAITASRSSAIGDWVNNRAHFTLVNPAIPGGREFSEIYWLWRWADDTGDHYFVGAVCPVSITSDGRDIYEVTVTLDLIAPDGIVIDTGLTTLTVTRNTATDLRHVIKDGSRIVATGPSTTVFADEVTGNDTTGDGTSATPYRSLARLINAEINSNQVWLLSGLNFSGGSAVYTSFTECSLDVGGGLSNFEICNEFPGLGIQFRPTFRIDNVLATSATDDFFVFDDNNISDLRFVGFNTIRRLDSVADEGSFLRSAGNGVLAHLTFEDLDCDDDRKWIDVAGGTGGTHHTGIYIVNNRVDFGYAYIELAYKSEHLLITGNTFTNVVSESFQDKLLLKNCRYFCIQDNAISGWRTGALLKLQVDDTVNSWVDGADRACEWGYIGDGAQDGRHNDLGFQNQKAVADPNGFVGIRFDATPSTLEGNFNFIDINANIIGPHEIWIQEAIRVDASVHNLRDIAFRNNWAGFAAPDLVQLENYIYNGLYFDEAASGVVSRLRITISGNTLMRFQNGGTTHPSTIYRQHGDDANNTDIRFRNNLIAINIQHFVMDRNGGLFTDTDTDYDFNFYLRTNWIRANTNTDFGDDDAGGVYDAVAYIALANHETGSVEAFSDDPFLAGFDPISGAISTIFTRFQDGDTDPALRYQFGGNIRPSSPTPGHQDFGTVDDNDNVIGSVRVSNWEPGTLDRFDIQTCVLPLADRQLRFDAGSRISTTDATGVAQDVQWHQMGLPYPSGYARYARIHFNVRMPPATTAGAAGLPYSVYTDRDIQFTSDPVPPRPWNIATNVLGILQLRLQLVIQTDLGLLSDVYSFNPASFASLGTQIETDEFNAGNSIIRTFRIRGRTGPLMANVPSFWWELIYELGRQNHVKFWFSYGNSEVRPDDSTRWTGTACRIEEPITLTFTTLNGTPLPAINVHTSDYAIPGQVRSADNLSEVLTLMDPFDDVLENNPNHTMPSDPNDPNSPQIPDPLRHNRSSFPDGASQVFSGTFSFNANLTQVGRELELATANAEAGSSMFSMSLDWDKHNSYGPIGYTGPLPDNQFISDVATAKVQAAFAANDAWNQIVSYPPHNPSSPVIAPDYGAPRADPWHNHLVGGISPDSGRSGAAFDFGVVKLEHIAKGKIPDFRAYRKDSYQMACRIFHWRETDVSIISVGGPLHNNRIRNDGTPLNLWSNIGLLDGRTHMVSVPAVAFPSRELADNLGKLVTGTVTATPNFMHPNRAANATNGWDAWNREHQSANTQFCYVLMTGDRYWIESELHAMSEMVLASVWPTGPVNGRGGGDAYRVFASPSPGIAGFRLDTPFQPRAAGRAYQVLSWLALLTGRQDLVDRLIDQGTIVTGQRRIGAVDSRFLGNPPVVGASRPYRLDSFNGDDANGGTDPTAFPPTFPNNPGSDRGSHGTAVLPWQLGICMIGLYSAKKVLDLVTGSTAAVAAAAFDSAARDQARVCSLDTWRRNNESGFRRQLSTEFWFAIDGSGTEAIPMRDDQMFLRSRTFDGWKISNWDPFVGSSGKGDNVYPGVDLAYEYALAEGDLAWRDFVIQIYNDNSMPARVQGFRGWGIGPGTNGFRFVVADAWITRSLVDRLLDVEFTGNPGLIAPNNLTIELGLPNVTFVPETDRTNPFTELDLTITVPSTEVLLQVQFESTARSLGFPDQGSFVFFIEMDGGSLIDLIQLPETVLTFNEGVLSPTPFTVLQLDVAQTRDLEVLFSNDSPGGIGRLFLDVDERSPFTTRVPLLGQFKVIQRVKVVIGDTMTFQNQSFEMKAGNSLKIQIFIENEDGTPTNVTAFTTIEWVMKREVDAETVTISKSHGSGIDIVSLTGGTADRPLPQFQINLLPADTQLLSGQYYHEAEISISGDDATVLEGQINIRPSAIL